MRAAGSNHVICITVVAYPSRSVSLAICIACSHLESAAGGSPQPIEPQALHQSGDQSQPAPEARFPAGNGKTSNFQPLRRAEGSILPKPSASTGPGLVVSMRFQAHSRAAGSPVATASAASGTAIRTLSGVGPHTIHTDAE